LNKTLILGVVKVHVIPVAVPEANPESVPSREVERNRALAKPQSADDTPLQILLLGDEREQAGRLSALLNDLRPYAVQSRISSVAGFDRHPMHWDLVFYAYDSRDDAVGALRCVKKHLGRTPVIVCGGERSSVDTRVLSLADAFLPTSQLNASDAGAAFALALALARQHRDRKLAEHAMNESEARLLAILDAEPEGLATVNAQGMLLHTNASGLAIIEAESLEQVQGRCVFDMLAPEHVAAYRAFHERVLLGHKETLEFEVIGLHGTRRWIESNAVPLQTDQGSETYVLSVNRDVTDRKRAAERLEYISHHDTLTGLPNRRLLADDLNHAIDEAESSGRCVVAAVLDIDNFKNVNAQLGMAAGDALLRMVGGRLASILRDSDTVSRITGDSFGFVLCDLERANDIGYVAARLLSVFTVPFHLEDNVIHLTACLGVATYPNDGVTVESLLRNADMALHRARERGTNSYCLYTEEMTRRVQTRMELERDLRSAPDRNEFELFYQPLFQARGGQLAGAEALLRWRHPERGMISPTDFIPVAEEVGLIVPIGEWALRSACTQARQWLDAGLRVPVSVNLSPLQFKIGSVADKIAEVLQETQLDASLLTIEITESMLLENTYEILDNLLEIRNMGVTIAIDDFGTGYSSFSYVKKFRANELKIDRSFVQSLATNPDDAAITNAMITMAHSLGMRVTAEGVETAAQADILRGQSCDVLQGFLFSKPVPAKQFTEMMSNGFEALHGQLRVKPKRPGAKLPEISLVS
jgi:diguanylate cyclase (GGDEF)-like protein/PAS domain S-box-containing protein